MNEASAKRYPIYLRILRNLYDKGIRYTQSKDLSELTNIESSIIRRDFSKFGKLGKKGKGYSIKNLITAISKQLDADSQKEELVIVGAGSTLGKAFSNYNKWNNISGKVICGFETYTVKDSKIPVYDLKDFKLKKPENCKIAIVCTYKHTQNIVNMLVSNGITGIINYSSEPFTVPNTVIVINSDLSSNIQQMIVRLNHE